MTRKPIQRKIPSQLFVYLFFDEIAIWNRFCNMAVCKAGPPTHTCIESRFWVLKKWSPLEQQYYRGGSHNLCSDYSCPLFLIKYRRNSSVKKNLGKLNPLKFPFITWGCCFCCKLWGLCSAVVMSKYHNVFWFTFWQA